MKNIRACKVHVFLFFPTCWTFHWKWWNLSQPFQCWKVEDIKSNWLEITSLSDYPRFHFSETRHRIAKFVFAGLGNSYRFGSWGTLLSNSLLCFWLNLFVQFQDDINLRSWIVNCQGDEAGGGIRDVAISWSRGHDIIPLRHTQELSRTSTGAQLLHVRSVVSSGEAALLHDTPVRDDPAVDVVIKVPSLEIPGRWVEDGTGSWHFKCYPIPTFFWWFIYPWNIPSRFHDQNANFINSQSVYTKKLHPKIVWNPSMPPIALHYTRMEKVDCLGVAVEFHPICQGHVWSSS